MVIVGAINHHACVVTTMHAASSYLHQAMLQATRRTIAKISIVRRVRFLAETNYAVQHDFVTCVAGLNDCETYYTSCGGSCRRNHI